MHGARGLARDAVWSYLALSATLVSSFVVTALGFRELPTALIGIYAIASATTSLLAVVDPAIALGVSRNVARLVAGRGDADEEAEFIATGYAVLVALGCFVVVAGTLLGLLAAGFGWISLDWRTWLMLGLVNLAFGVQLATAVLPAVLTGYSDFYYQAKGSVLYATLSVAVTAATLPSLGVIALGLGQVVAMTGARLLLLRRVRFRSAAWLRLTPRRPTRAGVHVLLQFAVPMLLLAIAGQVITWTDLVVVGGLVGAGTAALYRVGSMVPSQLIALIYRAFDVSFPRLSAGSDEWQLRATAALTRVFSALSAVALAGLVALRSDIVRILTGEDNHFAELIVVLFAATWAANVPAHGLGLLAIARGKQRALTPIVVTEAVANIVLTVLLVALWSPAGAAWATLITLAVSNLVVMPLVLDRRIPGASHLVVRDGAVPMLLSVAAALPVLLLLTNAVGAQALRIVTVGAATAVLAVVAAAAAAGEDGRHAIIDSMRRRRVAS